MASSCCGPLEDGRGREGTVRITRTRRGRPDSRPERWSETGPAARRKREAGEGGKKREERSIEVPGMKLLVALSATDDRVSLRVSISTVILVVEHLNETSRSFLSSPLHSSLCFHADLFLFSSFTFFFFFSFLFLRNLDFPSSGARFTNESVAANGGDSATRPFSCKRYG